MSEDATPEVIRPNQRVFVWRPIIRRFIFITVLALGAHLFLPLFLPFDPGLWAWLLVAWLAVALTGIDRVVAYRKTAYQFYGDRLVVQTGTLTTRNTIDLPYRNVTQVVLRLPFIERRFFSTGHLRVHAAGSAQGIAYLQSVDRPRQLYDELADRLRDNGFSLQRKTQLQREKPHMVGTILDTSGMAIGGLVALITIGLSVGGAVIDMLELANFYELYDVMIGAVEADDPQDSEQAVRATLGLAALAVLAGTVGLGKLALHFVDLNRRTYTLWDDVVDYEDGFLTETYKFIPIENLADTATEEPFAKRLFGMANVHLSPHGSAHGIRFPSMPRAASFRRHLDRLIESSQRPAHTVDDEPSQATDHAPVDDDAAHPAVSGASRRLPDLDAAPLHFGPSFRRRAATGITTALKLPLLIALSLAATWIAMAVTEFDVAQLDLPLDELSIDWAIYAVVATFSLIVLYQLGRAAFFCWTTKYRVGRRKMSWERDFISRDEVEFTNDKITGITVERDVLDRLMGSATISFRSIGNPTPLVFEDVRRAADKLAEIRRRLGISADGAARDVHQPHVGPLDFLWGRLFSTLFFLSLAAASLIASSYWPNAHIGAILFAAFPPIILVRDLLYYRRCRLERSDNYLSMRKGIFFIEEHHIPYDQIRSVITTCYPGRDNGILQIVPGSTQTISLRYLTGLSALHHELDEDLYAHPMRTVHQASNLDRTPVAEYQPMARNGIAILSILTLSLALITIVPAAWLYMRARRTSIELQEGLISRTHGIWYRTRQTVLTNRIDQILTGQGPTHSVFNNSVVRILTVGSSMPELTLGPLPNGQALYDDLNDRLPHKQ